jgi:hypothetical protein
VARFADGSYPNRRVSERVDTGYQQRDLRLRGDWRTGGHSRLSGYVGLTRRDYSHVSELDYSGPTGRLVFDWAPTAKLSLEVVARSEIGSEHEVVDNYVITRGIALLPQWAVSEKIKVRGRLERLRRDFGQIPLSAVRDDRTRNYGLSVEYEPLRALTITLSALRVIRSADDHRFNATANVIGLDARFAF